MFPARYPLLGTRYNDGPVLPLKLRMEVCSTQEEQESNLSQTFRKDYERFNEHMDTRKGSLHICGAGPSLEDSYEELSGDALAANAAIPYLLKLGVVPRYAMIWDASPLCVNFAIPNPYVIYLLASRCHASVFDRLQDCNIVVWHAGGDFDIKGVLERSEIPEPMVNGGSAAVTRALYLAYALGYREFHLHGADSSYRGDKTHVTQSLVPEKRMPVCVNKQWFDTTPEWAAQVEEFKCIYEALTTERFGANIVVHGNGLLPTVWKLLKEKECLLQT